MKLFFWTENEYEACNHKLVIANTLAEARDLVVAGIRESWKEAPKEAWETDEWIADHCENEVQNFLTDSNWQVREIEITPGVVSLY